MSSSSICLQFPTDRLVEQIREIAFQTELIDDIITYLYSTTDAAEFESLQKAILAGMQTERENLMPTCLDMLVEQRCEKLYGELINRSREKGREEGREEGVLIGQIRTLQQVFKLPVTPETDLKTLPIEQLRSLLQKVEATHGGTPIS